MHSLIVYLLTCQNQRSSISPGHVTDFIRGQAALKLTTGSHVSTIKLGHSAIRMSDDDRDIDIESDDGEDSDSRLRHSNNTQYFSQAEKRAHHNALERKRRDHIKDSFSSLRDSVPFLQGEKVASRAQILKKAADYIQFMRRKNATNQQAIDDLKRQNSILESQIRSLEKAKITGNFAAETCEVTKSESVGGYNDTESESSDSETGRAIRQPKKLKVTGLHH